LINAKKWEQSCRDDVDNDIDASGKQGRVRSREVDRLKVLGCIITDAVGSCELLAQHQPKDGEEPIANAWHQQSLPRETFRQQLFVDRCIDLGKLKQIIATKKPSLGHVR
jgi:hypothetical protein